MNAMEKVAWTELLVSVVTIVTVTCLFPWLGSSAAGAFGLLGLIGIGVVFIRKRGESVVVDERDREIALKATRIGVATAWTTSLLALIAITLWSGYANRNAVPTVLLTWLIWIQGALCYGVKGLVGVVAYRRQQRAT
jgi:hypothetical protein